MALSARTTSASIAVTVASARTPYPAISDNNCYFRVYNLGTGVAFVRSGDVTVVATVTDQYIPANGSIVIIRAVGDTNLAAITATGTSTIYFASTDSPMTSVG